MVAETFFYLLDVGTSNALVLFNEANKKLSEPNEFKPWNIVEFKTQLVEDLSGKKAEELFHAVDREKIDQHVAIRVEGDKRLRCVYCAMMNKRRRTRHICSKCEIPLCCFGNGKVEDDCFRLVHQCEVTMDLVAKKHVEMSKKDRSQK